MEKSVFTADYRVLVELLVETRKSAGVRQVDLAERLETTQSYVSKVEQGDLRLDVIQLRAVCLALNTSLTEFVAELEKRLARGGRRKRSRRRLVWRCRGCGVFDGHQSHRPSEQASGRRVASAQGRSGTGDPVLEKLHSLFQVFRGVTEREHIER